ncbi:hypothetical protein RCS94_07985 [Orbaceae bacterium ac157xtp]
MIAPLSYGVLSATSANTIKGSAPTFTGQSGAKKLGFTVQGTHYSERENNILEGTPKKFNAGLKLSDFVVTPLTANDFTLANDYFDPDGDVAHPTLAFRMDAVRKEWYQANGSKITDYNQTLGCGSNLALPLTLKITLPNVQVQSRYGNPKLSQREDLTKSYKISTESGICFAKPNQMIVKPQYTWYGTNGSNGWWNSSSSKDRNAYGGGYDSTKFDPKNGFKYNVPTKFPTTGFPGAKFRLIMSSAATVYEFESNNSAVTVSTNGDVTLNSKPVGSVTIKATLKSDTSVFHNYTFNPTSVWVVPQPRNPANSNGRYKYAQAKSVCGGESNIPDLVHLSNSPWASGSAISAYNGATRTIGGGISAEWGSIYDTYPDSAWSYVGGQYYWTRNSYYHSHEGILQTLFEPVSTGFGHVIYTPGSTDNFHVVCFG